MSKYKVLAFYQFTDVADPHGEVLHHKTFCEARDITARIYISEYGINGQMSGSLKDTEAYIEWMSNHPIFSTVVFKMDDYHEHAFPRLTIKYRKQLVALDDPFDATKTGERLTPEQWKEKLDHPEGQILIDVRNDYEWKVGKFQGATTPQCSSFREFREYAENLQKKIDPRTTPILMYCTGGIRCEAYSAYLKDKGFQKVYQLEGGIINYGKKVGSKHWLGKLFVFDDRLTTPISNEKTEIIGTCKHCQTPSEAYYNCANMDCNELFLCCPSCLETFLGCCQTECKTAERLRPYHQQNPHKPFRKWYNYFK